MQPAPPGTCRSVRLSALPPRKPERLHKTGATPTSAIGLGGAVEDLELVFEPLPSDSLTRFLTDNVINLNYAKTGISDGHPVGYFLKNARGEWLGGLTGYIWGGLLHVNFVWVTDVLRGQGH